MRFGPTYVVPEVARLRRKQKIIAKPMIAMPITLEPMAIPAFEPVDNPPDEFVLGVEFVVPVGEIDIEFVAIVVLAIVVGIVVLDVVISVEQDIIVGMLMETRAQSWDTKAIAEVWSVWLQPPGSIRQQNMMSMAVVLPQMHPG